MLDKQYRIFNDGAAPGVEALQESYLAIARLAKLPIHTRYDSVKRSRVAPDPISRSVRAMAPSNQFLSRGLPGCRHECARHSLSDLGLDLSARIRVPSG